jgi:hypothetical protein
LSRRLMAGRLHRMQAACCLGRRIGRSARSIGLPPVFRIAVRGAFEADAVIMRLPFDDMADFDQRRLTGIHDRQDAVGEGAGGERDRSATARSRQRGRSRSRRIAGASSQYPRSGIGDLDTTRHRRRGAASCQEACDRVAWQSGDGNPGDGNAHGRRVRIGRPPVFESTRLPRMERAGREPIRSDFTVTRGEAATIRADSGHRTRHLMPVRPAESPGSMFFL